MSDLIILQSIKADNSPLRPLIDIIPLTKPDIDWQPILSILPDWLGRSPVKHLDANRQPIGDYRSFFAAISEMYRPDENRILDIFLDHLSFSFLIRGPFELIYEIPLSATSLKYLRANSGQIRGITTFLMSGTLRQFKDLIINNAINSVTPQFRLFWDRIFLYFQHLGLEDVWRDYSKITLLDGTFILRRNNVHS